MMRKKVKIIIAGVIVYWIAMIFYGQFSLKLFWHLSQKQEAIDAMFLSVIAPPFILGIIMSIILKDKYSWIYGVITFHIYMILDSLLKFIFFVFIYRTDSISKELGDIIQHYKYGGIEATLFTIIGGLSVHYFRKLISRKTGDWDNPIQIK